MKPKKLGRNTKCITCDEKIADLKAVDCQLCVQWACLPCAEVSTELFEFLHKKDESMSFLCKACKEEIPTLREMKGIQQKQAEMEEDIVHIKRKATETKNTVEEHKETLALQGTEIARHETELKEIFRRLEEVESRGLITEGTEESNRETWANVTERGRTQIQNIVRSQVNEQAEIEKIRKNLVISGMAETGNEEDDKTRVLNLIEQELDITADINKVERLGRPRPHEEGEDPPPPRLLKLYFVTQRSRKEVLAKVTRLRASNDEHIKKLVYIRPDLTAQQLKESKNLRTLLRKIRTDNSTKKYKIHRNQIIEVASTAGTPTVIVAPAQEEETH